MCKKIMYLFSLIIVLGLVSGAKGEIIDSFESGPGSWEIINPPETLAQSTEGVTDGTSSLQRNFTAGFNFIDLDVSSFVDVLNANETLEVDVTTSLTAEQVGWYLEQRIILQGGNATGDYYIEGPLVSIASPDGTPTKTTVSFDYKPEFADGPLTGWAKIRLVTNTGGDGVLYYDNLRAVSAAPPLTAVVIGDFENGSLDNWVEAWEGSPVLVNSTAGVTSGSGSLSVTTTGGYYCLQWNAPTVPASLAGQSLVFDLTMIASEWPVGLWTKVAEKVALNSDSPSGWKEYTNATAIDKLTGEPTSLDWGRWWDTAPDVVKTYSVDISDYNLTGATWFQIIITIQGGDGLGHFYFDNVQLISADEQPPADTPKSTDTIIGNWEQDMDGWLTGTPAGLDPLFNDHNGVTLDNYSFDVWHQDSDWQELFTLDLMERGLVDAFAYNQEISVDITRLVADWPTDTAPNWGAFHMAIDIGGDNWNLWQDLGYNGNWVPGDGDQTATVVWNYGDYLDQMDFADITWASFIFVSNYDPAYTGGVLFYLDNMKLFGGGVGVDPQPASGAIDVPIDSTLSWTTGTFATSHHVYFGTNRAKVNNADMDSDPDVVFAALDANSFDPNGMEFKTQYFWRVDEVNEANPDSPWKGLVWNFTTGNFIVVDDFEDYNIGENRIWHSWHDGLGYGTPDTEPYFAGNGTGSGVGDDTTPSFCEETIVHTGGKSMPVYFNNTGAALISEAQRDWAEPQDWTINSFNALKLYTHGAPQNIAGELYVIVEDNAGNSAKVTNTDSTIFTVEEWKEWVISFSELANSNVNMTAVTKLLIGVQNVAGQPGANGKFYIDDIRIGFEPIGLVAYHAFDNNVEDSSGNGHHGTLTGDPNFPVAYVDGPAGFGQAALFDGADDGHQYVDLGTFNPSAATDQLSIALWVKWDGPSGSWQGLIGKRQAGDWDREIMMWYFELERDTWDIGFHREGSGIATGQILEVGLWTHVAVTFDGTTAKVYVDGVVVGEGSFSFGNDTEAPMEIGAAAENGGNPFNGTLDEVRIYDIVLSEAEILQLAGK